MTKIGGIYQHYKGDLYVVIGLANQSDNGRAREPVVIYVSLKKGTINCRTEVEFHESVEPGLSRFEFLRTPHHMEPK